mmetsp:Transcript_22123/g.30192  ORF Transcript_22123/g.30192 Transcript_22123/m.30192 type:complete len:86 (+) Transcript_22123:330-587(+)
MPETPRAAKQFQRKQHQSHSHPTCLPLTSLTNESFSGYSVLPPGYTINLTSKKPTSSTMEAMVAKPKLTIDPEELAWIKLAAAQK